MKITDVKVFPVNEDKLKAYATITFDNSFIVRDLKVISGNKGYFIAMPSKKRKDGTFRDVAHPLNSETRKMIEDSVLEVYKRESTSGKTLNYDEEEAGGEEIRDNPSQPEIQEEPEKRAEEEPEKRAEEESEKRAEENPTIEPSDDPDKAFGYEE